MRRRPFNAALSFPLTGDGKRLGEGVRQSAKASSEVAEGGGDLIGRLSQETHLRPLPLSNLLQAHPQPKARPNATQVPQLRLPIALRLEADQALGQPQGRAAAAPGRPLPLSNRPPPPDSSALRRSDQRATRSLRGAAFARGGTRGQVRETPRRNCDCESKGGRSNSWSVATRGLSRHE